MDTAPADGLITSAWLLIALPLAGAAVLLLGGRRSAPGVGPPAAQWRSRCAGLLIALPLAGAAVLLLGGRRTDRWGHLLGTGTVVAAFLLGLLCTVQLEGGRRAGALLCCVG